MRDSQSAYFTTFDTRAGHRPRLGGLSQKFLAVRPDCGQSQTFVQRQKIPSNLVMRPRHTIIAHCAHEYELCTRLNIMYFVFWSRAVLRTSTRMLRKINCKSIYISYVVCRKR